MSLKICRSCLCESDEMKSILNLDLIISELDKRKFIDCFRAITDIYIGDNAKTSMPTTICEKCENDLIFSYKFRLQCQISDIELKSRFVVKTEVEDENIVLEPIVEINIGLESSSSESENDNMNEPDSPDVTDSNDDDDNVESEPTSTKIRTRSRRKSRQKISNPTSENVSAKKILHTSILNCEEIGEIKAVFKCIHCDEISETYNGYTNHKKIHESYTPVPTKCPICEKEITKFFARHLISHTEYRPYKCLMCNFDYTNANALLRHFRYFIKIPPTEDHKCTVCEKTFRKFNFFLHY